MKKKDLIVLVADLDQENLLKGWFRKLIAVEGWPPFSWDIKRHEQRDPGVRTDAATFMRIYQATHQRALVLLDHDGSGADETHTPQELEAHIQHELIATGWPAGRCAVSVVAPEIESWVWVGATHMQEEIGWKQRESVYDWLRTNTAYLPDSVTKPIRPKEAFEEVLRRIRRTLSPRLYEQIAARASYRRCTDPSFQRLLAHLRQWFGHAA